MSTHNIQFHDKIRKVSIFVVLSYRKNFVGTQKRRRISHGKRAIAVRAAEVQLYIYSFWIMEICSRHGEFEPLRFDHSTRSGGKRG